jgi:hypothetical protein
MLKLKNKNNIKINKIHRFGEKLYFISVCSSLGVTFSVFNLLRFIPTVYFVF